MDIKNLQWLAGLLEGEGCFSYCGKSPTITLVMVDRDVVDKAAELLNAPLYGPRSHYADRGWQPTYCCKVYGPHAASWMMTLFPLMGMRRRLAIQKTLAIWKPNRQGKRKFSNRRGWSPTAIDLKD
jgi:hypothetical protein